MSVILGSDVTGPVPINSDDAADHTLVDQLHSRASALLDRLDLARRDAAAIAGGISIILSALIAVAVFR